MEFKGILKVKTDEISVGANGTPKQSIVVETIGDSKYQDSMMFDFIGEEKVANVRATNIGDIVKVSYNSKTTEYNGRYYNNLNGWKIDIEKKKEEEFIDSDPF